MVSTMVTLALYLGAPPALETPKAIPLERLPAPCSIGFRSRGPHVAPRALRYPKEPHLLLGAPRALVLMKHFGAMKRTYA